MSRKALSTTEASSPQWQSVSTGQRRSLGPEDIHIWRYDLSNRNSAHILSLEEQARAGRGKNDLIRTRYIASRVFVRTTLSQYLDLPADAVRFAVASGGKPYVDTAQSAIEFNLSHSGDLALLAVAKRPIGVDVESMSKRHNFRAVAQRAFSADDTAILASAERPSDKFIDLWTQLEARQKAFGEGIFGRRIARTAVCSVSFDAERGYRASVAVVDTSTAPVLQFFEMTLPW